MGYNLGMYWINIYLPFHYNTCLLVYGVVSLLVFLAEWFLANFCLADCLFHCCWHEEITKDKTRRVIFQIVCCVCVRSCCDFCAFIPIEY